MEELKKIYLAVLAGRDGGEKTIDEFRSMIKEDEDSIRASYSESTDWIQSQEFVEMVLHDSVFIVELILRVTRRVTVEEKDPLLTTGRGLTVYYDLILLENQLPYFILEKLFDKIIPTISESQKTRELIIKFFRFQDKIGNNSKFRHFTDLYRCVYTETLSMRKPDENKRNIIKYMYNADKLNSGGVKFKSVGEELSLNVTFKNGCLKMSCLEIADKSEMILRNIMALEQCHYRFDPHVCNYVVFLDYLIDTEKDVELLVKKGIIKNSLGEPASVARMVNKLGLGIFQRSSYYSDIADEVNACYSNPINRSQAVLRRMYKTGTIAATFLLVMTLIQTVASIIQVMQNAS